MDLQLQPGFRTRADGKEAGIRIRGQNVVDVLDFSGCRGSQFSTPECAESPRSRTWPTEGGNEPGSEPGWDPTGTVRPDVIRQVFEEWKATGEI